MRLSPKGPPAQKANRIKSESYLHRIRQLPCLILGTAPSEAAHVRFADHRWGKPETGIGRKPDDRWTVPLSAEMHRLANDCQHAASERAFWKRHGIDPLEAASALWDAHCAGASHFDLEAIAMRFRIFRR